MDYYAGIDVSLEQSSVCVVDGSGKYVREFKCLSEPDALVSALNELGLVFKQVGLEAGPLSQWLFGGLVRAGFSAVLLETRQVKAALSAMTVKTDRKDARGIAQILRMGWFQSVHCKSAWSQEIRALLVARKLLLGKAIDIELGIRGILRGFGLKIGRVSTGCFTARVRELASGHEALEPLMETMLVARESMRKQQLVLHRKALAIAKASEVCRRLISVPGVGALTSLTYWTAIDDPSRFSSSKTVGAHFGLTPRKYQSGETDISGGISKVGDGMVRSALFEAAQTMLRRSARFSSLKCWAMAVAKRRGMKRAIVALARKLAVILHRMWLDQTEFRYGQEAVA